MLVWLERRRPLRRQTEPKLKREGRNLVVASLAALVVRGVERPLIEPLTKIVEQRRMGILKIFRLPQLLEVVLAVVLLDYTLYLWHVLTHRQPLLWRFHLVHHIDLDLDTSTALRFHFGELLLSIPWRAGQVLLLGIGPVSLSIWQMLLFVSIMFHHSNVNVPLGIERILNHLIVTPRMHGIHHSMIEEETNSNWSSGLTIWDRLHGTLRLNVPQSEITIGIPAYRDPEEVKLSSILQLPFGEQRAAFGVRRPAGALGSAETHAD